VFPGESASRVRAYIRQKLNNADKGCKRKLLKSSDADFITNTGVSDVTETGQQCD